MPTKPARDETAELIAKATRVANQSIWHEAASQRTRRVGLGLVVVATAVVGTVLALSLRASHRITGELVDTSATTQVESQAPTVPGTDSVPTTDGTATSTASAGAATAVLTASTPVPTTPADAVSFELESDGKAHLRGTFASEVAARKLLEAGAGAIGNENVVGDYTIDPAAPATAALNITQTLQFSAGAAGLQTEHDLLLDQVIYLLSSHRDSTADVTAFTDTLGDAAANLALSTDRAQSVAAYLTGHGVDAAQLVSVIGAGEAYPVADNSTTAGREANRRVQISIRPPA